MRGELCRCHFTDDSRQQILNIDQVLDAGPARLAGLLCLLMARIASGQESVDDLAREANDPTASLMAFNFIADYTGGFHGPDNGRDGDAWVASFRPVIPFQAFGTSNILRMTFPYQIDGRGDEGLGDVTIFDLVVFDRSWGRWGLGAVATLAGSDAAADDFALGPAIGGVYQYSKKLNLGLFNQNVFAGDTAVSQLQPIVAWQLGDGWSLSGGDLQYVYDWKGGRWVSVPIGFQLAKVTRLAGQAIKLAINPQYNLKDDAGLEEWSVAFTFGLLVPAS
jgi:hypothetical protein